MKAPYLVGFQLDVLLHPCPESFFLDLNGIDRTGQRRDAEVTVICSIRIPTDVGSLISNNDFGPRDRGASLVGHRSC